MTEQILLNYCGEKLKMTEGLFDGSDIVPELDNIRLTGQLLAIFDLMRDSVYRTLPEISNITGFMTSSISAQLRNLKKIKFGEHELNKRRRGEKSNGYWEYQIIKNKQVFIEYRGV